MAENIDSISFTNFFWIQYKNGRVSFRVNGMPEDAHFTISWHENSSKINLHVTKNASDQSNKPKIVIAELDKKIADEAMTFIPACIFNYLYTPISFKQYSRRSRKNMRLCYFDDMEKDQTHTAIEEKLIKMFYDASTTKGRKLRIRPDLENNFIPILHSPEMKSLLFGNIKNLTKRSINSGSGRAGILFMGKKSVQFISGNRKCFVLNQKATLYGLMTSFMKPELASGLIHEIQNAITQLQAADTFNDTVPFNRPYQLFIENAG